MNTEMFIFHVIDLMKKKKKKVEHQSDLKDLLLLSNISNEKAM